MLNKNKNSLENCLLIEPFLIPSFKLPSVCWLKSEQTNQKQNRFALINSFKHLCVYKALHKSIVTPTLLLSHFKQKSEEYWAFFAGLLSTFYCETMVTRSGATTSVLNLIVLDFLKVVFHSKDYLGCLQFENFWCCLPFKRIFRSSPLDFFR